MCQNCDKNLPQKNSDKNIIHLPDLLRNTMPYFVSPVKHKNRFILNFKNSGYG
jgi:hypothetical protein